MKLFKVGLFLLFQLPFILAAQTPVAGCTDPNALNFNPQATINDGSCMYSSTSTNLPFLMELPNAVKETSGLAFFNGKLWTINDSGGLPVIYAIDTTSGNVAQMITLIGTTNVDWEDLTTDENFVYVADVGNNNGDRTDLTIHKVLKSTIPANGNSNVQAGRIQFVYEDQKRLSKNKNHNFDCEALIAAGDSLYLFTKNRANEHCNLYRLPKTPGTYTAKKIGGFDAGGLITGADFDPVKQQLVLTGYEKDTYEPFIWILFDFQGHNFLNGNKRRINLNGLLATQTEGIAFYSPYSAFISAEKSNGYNARIFRLKTSVWTGFTSVNEKPDSRYQKKKLEIIKNPVEGKLLRLNLKEFHQLLHLNIFDASGKILKIIEYNPLDGSHLNIDLSAFRPGLYYVGTATQNTSYSSSFILP